MKKITITKKFLNNNKDHILIFNENTLRRGRNGLYSEFRRFENTYGFITRKFPDNYNDSFFKPKEYKEIFKEEIEKLAEEIKSHPERTYLIPKLGSGKENKYNIYENVVEPGLNRIHAYENVKFLYAR